MCYNILKRHTHPSASLFFMEAGSPIGLTLVFTYATGGTPPAPDHGTSWTREQQNPTTWTREEQGD